MHRCGSNCSGRADVDGSTTCALARAHMCATTNSPLAYQASASVCVRPCKLSDRSGRRCIDVAPTVPVARTLIAPQTCALATYVPPLACETSHRSVFDPASLRPFRTSVHMWLQRMLHNVCACACTYVHDDQLPPLACETSALVCVRPCKLSDRSRASVHWWGSNYFGRANVDGSTMCSDATCFHNRNVVPCVRQLFVRRKSGNWYEACLRKDDTCFPLFSVQHFVCYVRLLGNGAA